MWLRSCVQDPNQKNTSTSFQTEAYIGKDLSLKTRRILPDKKIVDKAIKFVKDNQHNS